MCTLHRPCQRSVRLRGCFGPCAGFGAGPPGPGLSQEATAAAAANAAAAAAAAVMQNAGTQPTAEGMERVGFCQGLRPGRQIRRDVLLLQLCLIRALPLPHAFQKSGVFAELKSAWLGELCRDRN